MFDGIPIWRSFEYFVNVESLSTIELGTRAHPYKDIESVFAEIINLHSNYERNVTVLIHKGTQTEMLIKKAYMYNMHNVSLISYSDNSEMTRRPLIIGVESSTVSKMYAKSTAFNILKNSSF